MALPEHKIALLLLALCSLAQAVSAQQSSSDAGWPTKAVARFLMEGVKGTMTFNQPNPNATTKCNYQLEGLQGNNKLFHVHVRPLDSSHAHHAHQACSDKATGGHLNPFNVTQRLPAKAGPLESYELGDLSGKHGPLKQIGDDKYQGSFEDSKLPLGGLNGIVGRSIVIHKNDGKRWVCANILAITA